MTEETWLKTPAIEEEGVKVIGQVKRIVTGENWSSQPASDLRMFADRLTAAHLELREVRHLEVDGGDITAFQFHRNVKGEVHAAGHCNDESVWAYPQPDGDGYKCTCWKPMKGDDAGHDVCLVPVVI